MLIPETKNPCIDIIKFKDSVINAIMSNREIIKLVDSDKRYLIWDNILPYIHIPDKSKETKTYICIEVDGTNSTDGNIYLQDIYVTVKVMTHESLMRLEDELDRSGTRIDNIADEIKKSIQNSNEGWIGNLVEVKNVSGIENLEYPSRTLGFVAKTESGYRKNA